MRVALHACHPSQVWVLKPLADAIRSFADVTWVVRDKDICVRLAELLELDAIVLSRAGRGMVSNAVELAANIPKVMKLTRDQNIDLWVSKHSSVHIASRLMRMPSLCFNDDDADVIPLLAWTAFPFSTAVLVPDVIRMGRFQRRAIAIPSHFELCYLHPNRFTPDRNVVRRLGLAVDGRYAVVRLSALEAHHDVGVQGIDGALLRSVIAMAAAQGMRIFITSEKPLVAEFESYRLPVSPTEIHHVLACAEFLLSDSQTMTSESAVLGTPAFRVSDFVGRLSSFAVHEKHRLAFGYRSCEQAQVLADIGCYLQDAQRQSRMAARRARFLAERGDPLPGFVQLVKDMLDGGRLPALRGAVQRTVTQPVLPSSRRSSAA